MAMAIDSLSSLPPELRQCVYSWLFFADEASTVWIREMRTANVYAKLLVSMLALPEDPTYVAYGKKPHQAWPQEVEDAFFQGM